MAGGREALYCSAETCTKAAFLLVTPENVHRGGKPTVQLQGTYGIRTYCELMSQGFLLNLKVNHIVHLQLILILGARMKPETLHQCAHPHSWISREIPRWSS